MASAALAHDDGDVAYVRLVGLSMIAMAVDVATFPRYSELMLPLLQAVQSLGGSASSREITAALVELQGFTDEQMAVTYPTRDRSVLWDRMAPPHEIAQSRQWSAGRAHSSFDRAPVTSPITTHAPDTLVWSLARSNGRMCARRGGVSVDGDHGSDAGATLRSGVDLQATAHRRDAVGDAVQA